MRKIWHFIQNYKLLCIIKKFLQYNILKIIKFKTKLKYLTFWEK